MRPMGLTFVKSIISVNIFLIFPLQTHNTLPLMYSMMLDIFSNSVNYSARKSIKTLPKALGCDVFITYWVAEN